MGNFYASYPFVGGGGVPVYANLAAFPVTATQGDLGVAANTGNLYEWSGAAWQQIGGPGSALSLGNLDAQAAGAKGAALVAGVLSMQSADTTHAGLVNITTQSFAGNKTFTGTIAASNLSGTNTGDVTLTAVGAVPSANAASLSGQALTLQPFDGTHPGVVTASGGGSTNFARADGTWAAPAGSTPSAPTSIGALDAQAENANGLALVANVLSAQSADATHPGLVNITTQSFAGDKTFTGNVTANNFLDGYATTATAAATTTLTVSSAGQQYFTGATTQIVLLPVTSTLVLGQSFLIVNNSTGIVTVKSSGANTVLAMQGSTSAILTCILTSGTTAASWSVSYQPWSLNANGVNETSYFVGIGTSNPNGATLNVAATGNPSLYLSGSSASNKIVMNGPGTFVGLRAYTSGPNTALGLGYTGNVTTNITDILTLLDNGNVTALGALAASNLSGTNTGDVTLAAFGSTPNANGLSISGQALNLQPADATHSGGLSSTDWNTFNSKGSGTVTAVSVASSNGFAGSSSGGATPALTLSTSITGVLIGNGTAISAAAGTDLPITAAVAIGTVTTTATVTWSSGSLFTATLTSGNTCVVSFSGAVSGQTIVVEVTNGSAGGTGVVTWPSVKWAGGTPPTMTTGTAALDVYTFIYNGSYYVGSVVQNLS